MHAPVTGMDQTTSKQHSRQSRLLFAAIVVFAVVGMIVSGIALQRHYAKSATGYCDFGEKFNCDIVNRSEYSAVLDIPVAAIGVAGYAAIFALSTYWRSQNQTPVRLLIASLAGLAFALYLTYIEAYKLEIWCILCLSSLVCIAAIAVLSMALKMKTSMLKA
jgi:vitamin-K-epoxide reductase (warfarin-sensitive)